MAPIPAWLVATVLGLSLTYLIGADLVKIRVFARYQLR